MSFIKLDRKITEWEWFTDANTLKLWIYLLVNANYKDGSYKGIEIKRGQLVTGRKKLAERLGMSERQIRSQLEHLQTTNEVTIKATNKYSIITIVKYDFYQSGGDENDQQNDQQNANERPTECPTNDHNLINKEIKEREEIKNNTNAGGKKPFVKPTLDEIKSYCIERGYTQVDAERFFNYYEKNGWMVKSGKGKKKMANWKLCVNSWVVNEIRYNETNETRNKAREAYIKDVEMREQQKKKREEGNWF